MEPWRTLTKLCIDKFHGYKVQGHKDLEGFNLSTIETHLYERGLSYLDEEPCPSSGLRTYCKFAQSDIDMLKDIIECCPTRIVDLQVAKLKDFTSICPELEHSDPEVTRVLHQLSKYLRLGMRTLVLKCDVILGLQAQKELDGEDVMPQESMMNIVRYLANMIDSGNISVSESEMLAIWKMCLETHMCKATQMQKRLFTSQFGAPEESESGRKVNLLSSRLKIMSS
ncbi:hypothetical protein BGZ76_005349 [Entomortierella beljakovae]|nr:hypothetical protein BGZ76_005349 [Entomortierella beljakovae]